MGLSVWPTRHVGSVISLDKPLHTVYNRTIYNLDIYSGRNNAKLPLLWEGSRYSRSHDICQALSSFP